MADNTIVISAELRELTEKQVTKFAKALTKSITTALSSVAIDFSKTQVTGTDKLATKFAKQFQKDVKSAFSDVVVDSSKLGNFKIPVKLDLTEAKRQLDEFARTNTLTVKTNLGTTAGATRTASTAATSTSTGPHLSQRDIDAATNALKAHRAELFKEGAHLKEVDKETAQYTNTINRLQKSLALVDRIQRDGGTISEKHAANLRLQRIEAEDLTKALSSVGTAQALSNIETRRGEAFMESFGFKVGIVGFGLGILGGHLKNFSQLMLQAVDSTAQLIEPLERVNNALAAEGRSLEDREALIGQLRELADLPASNLKSVAQSFRSLGSLKLGDQKTLDFIEGLTKATAFSGTGAEGSARLIEQFRQFIQSGILTQRDIRTISEQGGVKITDALRSAFGTTDAETLQKIGPQVVVDALIQKLKELPEPAATATDHINRLQNSLTMMRFALGPVLEPGLGVLVNLLKQLEGPVTALSDAFKNLTPGLQKAISVSILLVPVFAGLAGTVLTIASALAILIAAGNQVIGMIGILSPSTGRLIARFGLLKTTSAGIGSIFVSIGESLKGIVNLLPRVNTLLSPFTKALATLSSFGVEGVTFLDRFTLALTRVVAVVSVGPFLSLLNIVKSLGSAFGFIARIIGLTPWGVVINALIAIVTNAGHARDVLFDAFSVLGDALGDLSTKLKQITGLSLWDLVKTTLNFVLRVLDVVVGAIGGALVDALATIVIQIADIVKFFTTLVDLIQNPSWDNLGNFFYQLYKATLGWIETISKLLAATILDVLGEALQKFAITKGLGETLSKSAEDIRKQFKSTGDEASKSVDKIADSVKNLNNSLNDTDKLSQKLIDSFNDMNAARVAQDLSLQRAAERFDNAQRQRAAEAQLDTAIRANPTAALPTIRPTLTREAEITSKQLSEDAASALKAKFAELRPIISELLIGVSSINKLLDTGPSPFIDQYVAAFSDLVTFIEHGNGELKEFDRLQKPLDAAVLQIDKLFKFIKPEERQRAVEALSQLNVKFSEFRKILADTTAAQDQAKAKAEISIQDKEREAEKLERINKALKDSEALKKRIADNQREIDRIQMLSTNLSYAQAQKNEERRNALLKENADLQIQIDKLLNTEADQNKDISAEQEQRAKTEALNAQASIGLIQLKIEKNKELLDLFVSGFSEVEKFQEELNKVDAARAALGLAPGARLNLGAVGTQLGIEAAPILRQQQQFGATTSADQTINSAISLLTKGSTLATELRDTLLAIGFTNTDALRDVQARIQANELSVEQARNRLAIAKEGSTEEKEAKANLNAVLDIQRALGTEAATYTNRLRLINLILGNNTKQISDQLRKQKDLNDAEIKHLNDLIELNRLREELQQLRTSDTGSQAPKTASDALIDIAREREARIRALEEQFRLEEKLTQQRILDVQAEVELGHIKKTEGDAEIARLRLRLQLLQQIKDEGVKQERDKGTTFSGAVNDLTDAFQRQYGAALQAANAIQSYLNSLATGQNVVATFQKVLDGQATKMDLLGEVAKSTAAAFALAFVGALRQALEEGENFFAAFAKILGDALVNMGLALIAQAIAATAFGAIWGVITGDWSRLAKALAILPTALATGGVLVALGTALGGLGASSKAADTNTANGADRSTGAQRNTFEPEKDPRFIFQKTMLAQISLEIKTDDSQIIKAVINGVNQNGRLTRLIGNRKLEFTV